MSRNTLIGFVLIGLVLLFWPTYLDIVFPEEKTTPPQEEVLPTKTSSPLQKKPLKKVSSENINREAAVSSELEETFFEIEPSLYSAVISNKNGGSISSFVVRDHLKDGEDKRFRTILPSFTQLFMTWTLSAAWVFIQSLAALVALTSLQQEPFGIVGFIGLGLWIFGFIFQVVADHQKTQFKANSANEGNFITEGLWSISRHPNYFGEIVLWTGIAVMALPVMSGLQYVSLISPVFGFLLIYFVSGVRLLENKANKKWGNNPDYQNYKKNTPIFVPKFFK